MRIGQLLPILMLLVTTSCRNENGKSKTTTEEKQTINIDTTKVLAVFDSLKTDSAFAQNTLIFGKGASDVSVYDGERPILIGDINNDGKTDALMPFSVEFEKDYTTYNKLYYAVLLNQNGILTWKGNFNREDFPSSYYFPNQALTIEKIGKEYLNGYISEYSFSTKTPVLLEYNAVNNSFDEIKLYSYFWNYDDLKWNGKLPLHTTKKEMLALFGQPDSISDFFSECNYNNGPKKVYHYETLRLFLNEANMLENEEYQFDNKLNVFIQYQNIKLDRNTTYDDILKLSPDMLKQQPRHQKEEEEIVENDGAYNVIYIPLHQKITNDAYFDLNWVILRFKNGYLHNISIPLGDCEI